MSPVAIFDDELSETQEEYYGLGYLDFPDSRYLITKSSVIIGRPGDDHLALGEVSDGSDSRANGNESCKKRKRSEDDEDGDQDMLDSGAENGDSQEANSMAFQGGLGGPQEHAFQYYDDQDTNYIYVWPPASKETGLARNVKAISKRHLRLTLTTDNEWLLDVLGRNGVVVNRDFHPCGSRACLDHGDTLWFAGVQCQFNIPEPNKDETPYSDEEDLLATAGYDFSMEDVNDLLDRSEAGEDGEGEDEDEDEEDDDEDDEDEDDDEDDESEEEDEEEENESGKALVQRPLSRIKLNTKTKQLNLNSQPRKRGPYKKRIKQPAQDLDNEMEDGSSEGGTKVKKSPKSKLQKRGRKPKLKPADDEAANAGDETVKKRGPGRPPKDGVMSKRARRALEKAAEAEMGDEASAAPKRKSKQPKSSDANGEEVKPVGRKIKKSARESADDAKEKTEENKDIDEQPKEDEPPAPPREPSPNESDFTEEQLMKPDRPYSVCLYKVLSENSRPLALPEIYEEFKKRWPYYRFRVSGEGWQSSIRHNLQSTKCVVQAGRHGKGHLWTVDPNIPLDHRTNNRITASNFNNPYYGNSGKATVQGFQAQNSQMGSMRPPNLPGFQGQQSVPGYQTPYSHATPYNYNQRQNPAAQQAGSSQYLQASGTSGSATQQQGFTQGQRPATQFASPTASMTGANTGANRQAQTPLQQHTGALGAMSQQRPMNSQQTATNRPGVANAATTMAASGLGNGNISKAPSSSSTLVMDESLMKERLHVFDQFRNRLLGMAQNDGQKRYYVDILDQGQQWCAKNTQIGATYDGPRTDIGQIVKAFQEAWEGHLRKKGLLKDEAAAASQTPSASAGNSSPATALAKPSPGTTTTNSTSDAAQTAKSNMSAVPQTLPNVSANVQTNGNQKQA